MSVALWCRLNSATGRVNPRTQWEIVKTNAIFKSNGILGATLDRRPLYFFILGWDMSLLGKRDSIVKINPSHSDYMDEVLYNDANLHWNQLFVPQRLFEFFFLGLEVSRVHWIHGLEKSHHHISTTKTYLSAVSRCQPLGQLGVSQNCRPYCPPLWFVSGNFGLQKFSPN